MIETSAPSGAARAAQHCPELLANTVDTVDLAGEFARFGTRFARALQPRLARLFDARKLETELVESEKAPAAALGETLGAGTHHARFALPGKALGVLASARVDALIGEFDRMLGGNGQGFEGAATLPASADRFARQIEAELLGAAAEASGQDNLVVAERGSNLAEIVPDSARAPVLVATLAVNRPDVPTLHFRIGVCEATFAQFATHAPVKKAARRSIGERGIENSALAQVELSTTATLVDMPVPLHRIAGLQVGAMLPVSIHRSVPLSVAETIIAHGAVGAIDDRVALEIHHTSLRNT